jgi:hypothetical protein
MFLGVAMRLSKENNVAMLLIKVSKRRSQQIHKKVCEKARETFELAHYVDYTNVRGKNAMVCYSHCKDPIWITLGHYSYLSNISDDNKK